MRFLLKAGDGVARRQAQLELVHDDGSEIVEDRYLTLACGPWHEVDHAQSAEVESVRGTKRDTEVKLRAELTRNQRIGQRPRICSSVANDPRCLLKNAGRAKARMAVNLCNVEAMVRFEPDAVMVDDTDDRDWNLEYLRRQRGYRSKAPSGGVSRMS